MRSLQIPEKKMHAWLRLRAVLSAGRAREIREYPQDLRRQQRQQAAQRSAPLPKRRRRELPRIRSPSQGQRSRLRLRRRHLLPPSAGRVAAERARRRQRRSDPLRLLQRPSAAGSGEQFTSR